MKKPTEFSFNDILSNKSKKLKNIADNKPYFENTNEILGLLYKNPSLQTKEDEDEDSEDKEMKAGSGMSRLKQIYGSGCNCKNVKKTYKRVVDNYTDIINHLEEHQAEGVGDPKDISQSKILKKEIKKINELHLTPANKIKKSDKLFSVSNPRTVQKNAFELFGKDAVVYKSDKSNKKYQILNKNTNKMVHFGDELYQDYTKHNDDNRRKGYIARSSKIKGAWKANVYSPNFLSLVLLWDADLDEF